MYVEDFLAEHGAYRSVIAKPLLQKSGDRLFGVHFLNASGGLALEPTMQNLSRAGLLALAVTSSAFATGDTLNLDPLFVTATRTPSTQPGTASIVITRQQIDSSLATDVAELLRTQAGIEIGRNGGPGQPASIFTRGTNSNHTLVLIDGVRINTATGSGPAIHTIDPELIERIEIVKGPRTTLWGTDALGGVINIITRKVGKPLKMAVSIGGGELGTQEAGVELAGYGVQLSWNHVESDGYPGNEDSTDDLPYDNTSAQLSVRQTLWDTALRATARTSQSRSAFFSFGPGQSDFRNELASIGASRAVTDSWETSLDVSRVRDELLSVTGFGPFSARSLRTAVDWQNSLQFDAQQTAVFGVTTDREDLTVDFVPEEQRIINSIYGQHQWTGERLRTVVALRYANHSSFGNEATWNIDVARDAWRGSEVSLSAGTGFAAPDIFDLFSTFGGNPDLQPETARNLEIGLRQQIATGLRAELNLFRNRIDDLIAQDNSFTLQNIDRADIEGAELSLFGELGRWTARISHVVQSARNAENDNPLVRRAPRRGTADVRYTASWWSVGGDLAAVSRRTDIDPDTFANIQVPGYALLGLSAQLRVPRVPVDVTLRIDNVLDADYATAAGFPAPPRTAMLRLRYVWQQATN